MGHTLEYDYFNGEEVVHCVEDPFDTIDEITAFLQHSLHETWIIWGTVQIDGKSQNVKIVLQEG